MSTPMARFAAGATFEVTAAGRLPRAHSTELVELEPGTRLTYVGRRTGLRSTPYASNEYHGFGVFHQLHIDSGAARREVVELLLDDEQGWPDWLAPVNEPLQATLDPQPPRGACRRRHPGWSTTVRRQGGDYRAVTKPRYWRLVEPLRLDRTDHDADEHVPSEQVELPAGTRLYYLGVSYAYDGIISPEAWHIFQPLDERGRAGECLTLHRVEGRSTSAASTVSEFPSTMVVDGAR